ncbi:unnamed protein product, partial [marine sediment metagenome]
MSLEIKHIDFRHIVPPLTGMRIIRTSSVNGIIRKILPSFPSGCSGLVFLRFGIERQGKGQVFPSPSETYLALDDWTPSMGFAMKEYIEKGDTIWVDVLNRDFLYPHTPVVVIEM